MSILHPIFLFLNIGSSEMILIVLVALMLFGGDKLPQIAKGLGKGIRDFKDASEGVKRELQNQIENFDAKPIEPVKTGNDTDAHYPAPENTSAVEDPFAPVGAVEEHETPLLEEHQTVHADAAAGHADVSHLIKEQEAVKIAENHISVSNVGDGVEIAQQKAKPKSKS